MERRIRHCLADLFDPDIAAAARLDNLGGHASLRIYWRVHLPAPPSHGAPPAYPRGESTLMAMVMPLDDAAFKSEEGGSSADPAPTELPFVNVQRYLAELGMPVPQIDYFDMAQGVLFLEDLSDVMFENVVLAATTPAQVEALYREAIDLLVQFQVAAERSHTTDPDHVRCIGWHRAFDRELLRWELDHYREWGLEVRLGAEHVAPHRAALDAAFDQVVDALLEAPTTLSLRDYQSRNIMRKNGAWVLIDFQDALRGPFVYDLVALLRDSYIELEPPMVERLVGYYAEAGRRAGLGFCEDAETVRRTFHLQTVQRKLKDAGRFVFIDRVKQNPSFLPYYEPSIGYVRYALDQLPELAGLRALVDHFED